MVRRHKKVELGMRNAEKELAECLNFRIPHSNFRIPESMDWKVTVYQNLQNLLNSAQLMSPPRHPFNSPNRHKPQNGHKRG